MATRRQPIVRAHPRACGENALRRTGEVACSGSSPRVRGKRDRHRLQQERDGLIPARAGKTGPPRWGFGGVGAHPRACGENVPELTGATVRVWLIPARAGKTRPPCGPASKPRGSSPRVRGKRDHEPRRVRARVAHPRACGENARGRRGHRLTVGSSPRVRGKPARRDRRAPPDRLIPARAGKTGPAKASMRSRRAHPRACGENATSKEPDPCRAGSSPRVRGKLGRFRVQLDRMGLIPARAGKTRDTHVQDSHAPAHPRACGENLTREFVCLARGGSSPRVRGKR